MMDNLLSPEERGTWHGWSKKTSGDDDHFPGSLVRAMSDRVREAPHLPIYREKGPLQPSALFSADTQYPPAPFLGISWKQ